MWDRAGCTFGTLHYDPKKAYVMFAWRIARAFDTPDERWFERKAGCVIPRPCLNLYITIFFFWAALSIRCVCTGRAHLVFAYYKHPYDLLLPAYICTFNSFECVKNSWIFSLALHLSSSLHLVSLSIFPRTESLSQYLPLSHTQRIAPLCVCAARYVRNTLEHNNNGFVAGTNMLCPYIHIALRNI